VFFGGHGRLRGIPQLYRRKPGACSAGVRWRTTQLSVTTSGTFSTELRLLRSIRVDEFPPGDEPIRDGAAAARRRRQTR